MTRDEIQVGLLLKVIAPRWDQPIETIARVTETGTLFIDDTWWFTVEWLTNIPKRSSRSLRLFEEDLPTFELVTEPIVIAPPMTSRQARELSKPLPAQAALPLTMDGDDE